MSRGKSTSELNNQVLLHNSELKRLKDNGVVKKPIALAVSIAGLVIGLNGCDSANSAAEANKNKVKNQLLSSNNSTVTPSVNDSVLVTIGAGKSNRIVWSDAERSLLQTLSITNLPDVAPDESNKYLSNPNAIELGKSLFFDPRLSETGTISCSTCHQPDREFSDGMRVASGVKPGQRNTPSLLGVSYQQWLFWDGRKDSVWSQALEPFENINEHNLTRVLVIKKVLGDEGYLKLYQSIFSDVPSLQEIAEWPDNASPKGDIEALKRWKSLPVETRKKINRVYSNIGKAIAAFEATLKFPESKFDRFLSRLEQGETNPTGIVDTVGRVSTAGITATGIKNTSSEPADTASGAVFTNAEQLGLKLFIGKASCISCHHSPLLSSQHFQNIGTGVRGKDMGRSQVAEAQVWDKFNCLGEYSDAPKESCDDLKFMSKNRHELSGSFKVPGLRNVVKTAPYMHDGRFKTLDEVVHFYANPPSQKRTGHHLPEISLDETEQKYLTEFLKTL